jgi:hypothetical protein
MMEHLEVIPYPNLIKGEARSWWLEAVILALSTKEEQEWREMTVWDAFARCCRAARIRKNTKVFYELETILWDHVFDTMAQEIAAKLEQESSYSPW